MPIAPSPLLQRIADGLLRWSGARRLGANDVYVWMRAPGNIGVAFVGPVLGFERMFRSEDASFDNRRSRLDLELQRALGMPGAANASGWPVQQFMDDGEIWYDSLSEGVDRAIEAALTEAGEFDEARDHVDTTLLGEKGPTPAAPWSPQNDPTPFYSAKKHKLFVSERPPWLVTVLADQHDGRGEREHLGANPCMILPRIEDCRGAVVGEIEGLILLNTHCMQPSSKAAEAEREGQTIRDCGGLLLPSLAVGPVPATVFGPLVLVGSIEAALLGMKPYKRGRGNWPVVAYATDAWTVGIGETLRRGSIELFQELTGNRHFQGGAAHFWSLGAPVSESIGPFGQGDLKPIANTKALATALKRRGKRWPRQLTQADFTRLKNELARMPDYYPYVEAKVNGVLGLDCFPVAVVPAPRYDAYTKFLRTAGFRGDVLVVEESERIVRGLEKEESIEQYDETAWAYAWRVRDAVVEYAMAKRLEMEVEVA